MHTEAMTINKLAAVSDLIRLDKQYGTLLLLSPALWSLFIASEGSPPVRLIVIFTLGAFLMRSAGCAINDIADRRVDALVARTQRRPLASGALSVKTAMAVFLILSVLAFSLVLMLNTLTILLSIAALGLVGVYPFVKRVSHLPQAFLGIAFGWGAVMAWSAVNNTVALPAMLIFIANIFWSTAYDTVYALQDIDDDRRAGVKSTAILFGSRVFTAVALLYAAFGITLGITGVLLGMGPAYFGGVFLSVALSLWMLRGVKANRERAFGAFRANAAIGAIILASIIIDFFWFHATQGVV
jgi:4-hydroxybenzoate polyprenyltransferase